MTEKMGCAACMHRQVPASTEPCATCRGDKWVIDPKLATK